MFPYLRCPEAAEVERALCAGDFQGLRSRLRARLAGPDEPDLRHILGLLDYFFCDFRASDRHLEQAFHSFRGERRHRSAAMVAISLGRLHYDGIGNQLVGRGWLARAVSLVEGEEPCLEQGWAVLGLVGCSVADTASLEADAKLALGLARRFRDTELECKALADLGLAQVSLGRTAAGMGRLDEAMTMLRGSECTNPIVASQVVCDLLSACERVADLARAETWLGSLEEMRMVGPLEQKPAFLFTHCRIAYGTVLCDIGRWTEADTALRLGLSTSGDLGHDKRSASRGALAHLWIQQGRLDDASVLLDGHEDRVETLAPAARLQLARGHHDAAAACAHQGLRLLGGDRMRAAPLLSILVDAELGRGHVDAAEEAASRLTALTAGSDSPLVAALVSRARGHIAERRDQPAAAVHALEAGLSALSGGGWPLLRAALHLDLAAIQEDRDPAAAIAEARAAMAIYQPVGAPAADQAAALLRRLGETVAVAPPRPGPLNVLSRREREVFELLGQGLSNPAIGRRLFITAKTAEHHVSSILGKLGLRSRAEVAAYMATLPHRQEAPTN